MSVREYIDEVINNIRSDRATTKSLLIDAMIYLKKNEENHKSTGLIVAKYLETLQRSNEQLVKVVSLINKKERQNVDLTEEDRDNLFEEIRSE